MKIIISDIQRFCLHDGPGIRTTVFLKGCNLSCPWCSNPENIDFGPQQYIKDGVKGIYGKEIELEEIKKEILKDRLFYENNGGVTFSGGEALLQFEKMQELFENLRQENINMCLETSLIVPSKLIDIAVKYIDLFIIDIKILEEKSEEKINTNVQLYLENIDKLFSNNPKVIFRIPLVTNYTWTEENKKEILKLLSKYRPIKVEIFQIHRLGEKKYASLGRKMIEFDRIQLEEIESFKRKIEELGIEVKMLKI